MQNFHQRSGQALKSRISSEFLHVALTGASAALTGITNMLMQQLPLARICFMHKYNKICG